MRNIEYQDFDNNILKSNKTSVVIFYADWCEKTKSLLSDLEQLEKDLIDINFFKMDINKSKNISSRYYISILPTISIFNHEGTFAKRLSGFCNKEFILKSIDETINNQLDKLY